MFALENLRRKTQLPSDIGQGSVAKTNLGKHEVKLCGSYKRRIYWAVGYQDKSSGLAKVVHEWNFLVKKNPSRFKCH